jgi:cell division protein FtsW (lipid II flippase)
MDMPEPRLLRRLQRTLLAFFLLAALSLVVVYVAAPSIYTNTLLLALSPTEHYLTAAPLLLVGMGGFLAIVMIGVLRRWRWVFLLFVE